MSFFSTRFFLIEYNYGMLRQKLQQEQLEALKNGNAVKLTTVRYIMSQIKNKEIDKNPPTGAELNDEEVVTILRKIAKELKESIDAFTKGKRDDLVQKSRVQLDIVSSYLPQEIPDEELKKEIDALISKNQSLYQQNSKALIGICVRELKQKADPSRITKMLLSYETAV